MEEGEVLLFKPIPHTHGAINRTDLATGLVAAATWSSNGLPLPKKSRPTRHHHIPERHKIIFVSVALYAHGASLLDSSAKIITPADSSSYLARATDMLLRLHTSTSHRTDATHEANSTQPTDNIDIADTADQTHRVPAAVEHPTDLPIAMEEGAMLTDMHREAPWQLVRSFKRRPRNN
jgi:hypothetical protein